jgi:hypothetical protein
MKLVHFVTFFLTMFHISFDPGDASRYGSGSTKMMRLSHTGYKNHTLLRQLKFGTGILRTVFIGNEKNTDHQCWKL